MLNPTANNWILPIKGEYFMVNSAEALHEIQVREHGMQIKIDWQPAETFNMLNERWWPNYFAQMQWSELVRLARDLGVKVASPRTRAAYVWALSDHYRNRFQ